ncbi:MAG: tetratricopeptide repeat protein [Prevotellaceae bacterium]|jgi:tetratricopeptide (TPR) repeat protein|nr:tetratricopeptide repeat protein [Prevotellaceae bacterium]
MANRGQKQQDAEEKVEKALGNTEQFLEKNRNYLIYGLGGVIVIALLVFGYRSFYVAPLEEEARAQMFLAEQYFRRDSLSQALNGDGNNPGFLQIIDEYGGKAGEAVYFYAGVCQLRLGEYEEAIANLKKFSAGDEILTPRAWSCIGDAYVQLGDYTTAVDYFLKAANYRESTYSAAYLLKAGLAYEALQKTDDALKVYTRIKDDYAQTPEGRTIDKYIGRINPTL